MNRQTKSAIRLTSRTSACLIVFVLFSSVSFAADKNTVVRDGHPGTVASILWLDRGDIASRDLFYGPGGKEHRPHSIYTFVKEDFKGSNPKFDVRDEHGIKWKVKLGPEAKPEVVATRFLWAVGYFADEDYFLPVMRVENMPRLKRGEKFVASDGIVHDVRLKLFDHSEKKVGNWKWRSNPFIGTREFNGLRVMMALINNWDLKTENNAVFEERDTDAHDAVVHYMVRDVGSSFGTTGLSFPNGRSKGNLHAYSHSKFISKISAEFVDFNIPTRPNLFHLLNPKEFISRVRMRWIGHHIPRADARWIGRLLAQLSKDQIRQAFRAADYSPDEVERLASVLEERIRQLNQL